jgi:hypothetical protein
MEHLSSDIEHPEQVQWRRDKVRDLQQRIQPKGDILNAASWISYSK